MNILELIIKNSYCHEDLTLTFKDGINYITGENESGKSEALSMLAYALYGTVALRDTADAYKNLAVTLTFKVSKTVYKVYRRAKPLLVKIEDGKEVNIAISTTAVNKAIQDILYEYDVFTLTNYTEQSETEAYNKMTKSERIKFIEKASGIEEAKLLEKDLESKKKDLNASIKSIKNNLNITPVDFTEDSEMESILEDEEWLEKIKKELLESNTELESQLRLSTLLKNMPEAPSFSYSTYTLESAKAELLKFKDYFQIHNYDHYKNSSKRYTTLLNVSSEIEKELQGLLKRYDKPVEYYEDQILISEANKLFEERSKLLNQGSISCPQCSHSFPLMYEALESTEEVEYKAPDLSVNLAKKGIEVVTIDIPELQKDKLTALKELESIEEDAKLFVEVSTKKFEYDTLTNYVNQYTNSYNLYLSSVTRIRAETEGVKLENVEKTITQLKEYSDFLSAKRERVSLYANKKAVYTARQELIDKFSNDLELQQKEYESVTTLLDSSKTIKLNIQQKFIPELNRKASKIINEITSGKRFKLEITDDFRMVLDNHDIKLYSGSAKVISNIAFRLAYIETFYDKSFPVFIGDEVDCYFDKTRAAELHKVFEVLKDKGYQIILVSHFEQLEGNILNLETIKA